MLPTATTAPLSIDSEDVPRLPDHLAGGPPMDFFLFTVSTRDLTVDGDGYLVAIPCKLPVRPGLNGVEERRGKVSHDGAILKHQRAGRVVVPDDFPCVAFGVARASYEKDVRGITRPSCAYRQKHAPTHGAAQYNDCWQRYEQDDFGGWYLEVDAEGYRKFLRDVAAWLDPQPHSLRALTERLRLEGRPIEIADIKIAGREPESKTTSTKRAPKS